MEEGEEARISIVALRPIAKGEEITINYLDDDDADYKSRQQMLWEKYLFNCYCEKCQEEKAQLDADQKDQKNEKETKTNTEEDAKDQPKEEEKVQTEQKPE
jgi:SET domain-containing protein